MKSVSTVKEVVRVADARLLLQMLEVYYWRCEDAVVPYALSSTRMFVCTAQDFWQLPSSTAQYTSNPDP